MAGLHQTQRIVIPESGRLTIYPSASEQYSLKSTASDMSHTLDRHHSTATPATASLASSPSPHPNLAPQLQQSYCQIVQLRQALEAYEVGYRALEQHVSTLQNERQGLINQAVRTDVAGLQLQSQLARSTSEIAKWKGGYQALLRDKAKAAGERDVWQASCEASQSLSRSTGTQCTPLEAPETRSTTAEQERDALRTECLQLQAENTSARERIRVLESEKEALEAECEAKVSLILEERGKNGSQAASGSSTTSADTDKTGMQLVIDHMSDALPKIDFSIRNRGEEFFRFLKANGHIGIMMRRCSCVTASGNTSRARTACDIRGATAGAIIIRALSVPGSRRSRTGGGCGQSTRVDVPISR